jgi:very-short-patch-repair endonuclease
MTLDDTNGDEEGPLGAAKELFVYFRELSKLRSPEVLSLDRYKDAGGDVLWYVEHRDTPKAHWSTGPDAIDSSTVVRVERPPKPPPPKMPAMIAGRFEEDFNPKDPESSPELRTEQDITDETRSALQSWVADWRSWAAEERPRTRTRALYEQLHRIMLELENQPETWEFVIGTGLVSTVRTAMAGSSGPKTVKRHLFTQQLEVTLDPDDGQLLVTAADVLEPFKIEMDMLQPTEWPVDTGEFQNDITSNFLGDVVHPLNLPDLDPLLRKATVRLGTNDAAHLADQLGPPHESELADHIEVRLAPALILRKRPQAPKNKFFQDIIDQLAKAGNQGDPLPPGLSHLFNDPEVATESQPAPLPAIQQAEHLLPLEANSAQIRVLEHLRDHKITVVQGPPGTGKTHTIANLLGGLLAEGQRILITAEKDQALREIRDKLPEGVRDLCVSSVGAHAQGRALLESSIGVILGKRDAWNVERERFRARMDELTRELDDLELRERALQSTLLEARRWETSEHSKRGHTGSPAKIATSLAESLDRHEWYLAHLDDGPDPERVTCLEFLKLVQNTEIDQVVSNYPAPLPDDWRSRVIRPEEFDVAVRRLAEAGRAFEAFADLENNPFWNSIRRLDSYHRGQLTADLDDVVSVLELRTAPASEWLESVSRDVLNGTADHWTQRLPKIQSDLDRAASHLEMVGLRQVSSDDSEPARFRSQAEQLKSHFQAGGRINGLRGRNARRSAETFLEAVRVDGGEPSSVAEIDVFLHWLDATLHVQEVERQWPTGVVESGAALRTSDRLINNREILQRLREVLQSGNQFDRLRERLKNLHVSPLDLNDLDSVHEFRRVLRATGLHQELVEARTPIDDLSEESMRDWNPVRDLTEAVQASDGANYRSAFASLETIESAHLDSNRRSELKTLLNAQAPGLPAKIESAPSEGWHERFESLIESIDWCRVRRWIEDTPPETATVNQDLADIRRRRQTIQKELVGLRAWDAYCEALSSSDRESLSAYRLAVRNLGKGTGKFAARRRAEVQDRLRACRHAVSAWILPLHRVFSDMRPEPDIFDVAIIDEASQAGVDANFLHYLAKKVVVIGDDRQVAPADVGINQQALQRLGRAHLTGVRNTHRPAFEKVSDSFFDHAQITTDPIALTEHFRCVPEIIEFSDKEFYRPVIKIDPVRRIGGDRLNPLISRHVADGCRKGDQNLEEAQAVVDAIVQCIEDTTYSPVDADGDIRKLTMGVISLTGDHQARLIERLLNEVVDQDEIRERQLRCGNATDFQGSERDVIFLSMVNAPLKEESDGSYAEARNPALTDETAKRRYNVACSRAKDQMWLFHSLKSTDLHRDDDLRRRLIQFFENRPEGVTIELPDLVPEDRDLKDRFDSRFEQKAFNEIVRRGYRVREQYPVHGKKIDLVVVGSNAMLAVECDGDFWHGPENYENDAYRQRDLERYGWTFFRIREHEFNFDRNQALAGLWPLLAEHGITTHAI